MDNSTDVIIDRELRTVWGFFITKENWQKWWGGDLQRVEPGWQSGARIFWGDNSSSAILNFIPEKELRTASTWLEITFRFYALENGQTRVEAEFSPRGGASFSDGGAAHKREMASTLDKLRQCVESIPGVIEAVEKTASPSGASAVPVKPEGNNYQALFSEAEWMTLQCAIYWIFRYLFTIDAFDSSHKLTESMSMALGKVLSTAPLLKSLLARQVLLSIIDAGKLMDVWNVCFKDPRLPYEGVKAAVLLVEDRLPADISMEFKITLFVLGRLIQQEHEKTAGKSLSKNSHGLTESETVLLMVGHDLKIPSNKLAVAMDQPTASIYDMSLAFPQNVNEAQAAKSKIESDIKLLEDNDPHVYFDAIDRLIKSESHELVLTSLLSVIGDATKTSSLRKNVAFALAHMACPRPSESLYDPVIPHVIELLGGQDINVRNWIIEGIGGVEFGKKVPLGLIKPISIFLDDPDWHIRGWAVSALGYTKEQSVVEPLIAKLNDGIWDVRRRAVIALGEIKDPRAIGPIKALAAQEKDMGGWVLGRIQTDFKPKITPPAPVKPVISAMPVVGKSSNLDAAINKYASKGFTLVSRTGMSASMQKQVPINWLILIGLLIVFWIGAIIYLATRKKYIVQLVLQPDGRVTESGNTLAEYERDLARETKTRKAGRNLRFLGILFAVVGTLFALVLYLSGRSDPTLSKNPGETVTALLACPTPIILIGLLMLAIGVYNLRRADKETGASAIPPAPPETAPAPTPAPAVLPLQAVVNPLPPQEKPPVAPITPWVGPIQSPISSEIKVEEAGGQSTAAPAAELSPSSQTGRLEGRLVEAGLKEENQNKRPSLANIPVFICPIQSDRKYRFDAKLMTRTDAQNAFVFDSVGIGEYVVLYNPFPINDEQAYVKFWDGRELDFTDLDGILRSLVPLAEAVEAGKAEAVNSAGPAGGLGMDVSFMESKAVRTTYIRGNTALWVPGQKPVIMEFVDKNRPLTVRIEIGGTTQVTVQCHAT